MSAAPITTDEARSTLRRYGEQIRALEKRLRTQIEEAADAEAVYRRQLALRFAEHRRAGEAVAEAEMNARSDVVQLSRERDVARDRVRACLEELEDRRGERNAFLGLLHHSRNGAGATP